MKNIMKNKKGIGVAGTIGLVLLMLLFVGGIVLVAVGRTPQTITTQQEVLTATGDCNVAPSLLLTANDAIDTGTTVATVNDLRLNGAYLGTIPSALNLGDKVELFFNASNYISISLPEFTITKCGKTPINAKLYASDDVTLRLFNTAGNLIGNSVQSVCALNTLANQTTSSNTISMKLEVQSAQKQSSGDLVLMVEVDNSTEVGYDGISVSGTGVTDGTKLSTYTVNATNSVVRAFNLPASTGGALNSYYINLVPKAGQGIGPTGSAGTYAKLYVMSKQAFVDTDGNFKVGIENANGVNKFEDDQTFGICIVGTGG